MASITSTSNDKVKYIQKLAKSSKLRNEDKVFIVEGIRMFVEIPSEDIVEIYYTEDAYNKHEAVKKAAARLEKKGKSFEVSTNVFKAISDTGTPQGILALVKMHLHEEDYSYNEDSVKPLILVIEKLQDPGNMGTIIRTAEGAGVTSIVVSPDCVDIYNPKVVRSTMGSIFRMKVIFSKNVVDSIKKMKENRIVVFGTHLDGKAFYDKDYRKPSAFLIGNEGNGLSKEVSELADELIRIPMMGSVESLNAATSVAVVTYEALRQRII